MATDRRRAAATLTTGGALTYVGGVLRHEGLDTANRGTIPAWKIRHPVKTSSGRALFRAGAKGRGRYAAGAALGLVGAPAMAVGGHDLVKPRRRRPVEKRDRAREFVREGLKGTADAANQRVQSARETPPKAKAVPLGVGLGFGALGSLGAHRALDRTKAFRGARHATRAGIAATVGTAAAGASFPVARHAMRNNREYEVTPAGVRRRKVLPKRPSSKGTYLDGKTMSRRQFRQQTVGKALKVVGVPGRRYPWPDGSRYTHRYSPGQIDSARQQARKLRGASYRGREIEAALGRAERGYDATVRPVRKADYRGRTTSSAKQRAAVYGAGATPIIGPLAAAHMASRYAPPGQRGRAAGKQWGGTTAGGLAGAAAGGYGMAHLAERNPRVGEAAARAKAAHGRASERVNRIRPVAAVRSKLPKGSGRARRYGEKAMRTKIARPLARQAVAAGVGAYAGKTLGAFLGGQAATTSNLKDQHRYNLRHPQRIKKSATVELPAQDRRKLARRKRAQAATSVIGGGTGLAALGLLAAGKTRRFAPRAQRFEHHRNTLLTIGAGVGGAGSLNFAGIQRREARAEDPRKVRKAMLVHFGGKVSGTACGRINPAQMSAHWSKVNCAQCHRNKVLVAKADRREPLTRMRADQAAHIVRRHGDAGPLPNNLSRSERMQAYEARYVHAGGHKAEKWQRRADRADKVKVGGLAGATAGGAAYLALRHPSMARRMGAKGVKVRHAADTATIGAATVSGAGELYASHARRRRSSYSNSKAGVAASALRRMRDYSA